MLTYSLDNIGSESLYLYLYQCIKNDILSGVLTSGERLPSKRSLAAQLGVSNITVENAYGILQSEGYIYSIPKKGFYVSDLSFLPSPSPAAPPAFPASPAAPFELPDSRLFPDGQNTLDSFLLADWQSSQESSCFADFVSNRTTPESFPFSIWAKLLRETLSTRQRDLLQTPPCGGVPELRSALCGHLKQFRGMEVRPEQIIVGAGTDYLYSLLIRLLGQDKIYAVENPGYGKIARVYRSSGVICRSVSMDERGIRIDELERQEADIAHISPSHHYPSGIVTPANRRYELLAWASAAEQRFIIEDDYDSEFRFAAKPMPTLCGIDTKQKVIYMNTFTKSLAPTIRISYMVLPPRLLHRFYRELSFYASTVSNFEQYTLAKFIRDGYFEKHINRMRNRYRSVRDALLLEIASSPLAARSFITEEGAGLHFILRLDTPLTDAELVGRAGKNGIRISCLSEYFHPGTDVPKLAEHVIVMNYSGIEKEKIREAVSRLADALV
ncbi:MAG: PLP-dependent aminotransferase family protein [Lachnospiraceae bacterium]|nr:PLP-dependent aminotransferase family protein [Lachnospiraceae bacterium]